MNPRNDTLAMIFPGQGSQAVGMLQELAGTYTLVKDTFSEASKVLGYDLWALVQNGPDTELNLTDRTQPAMLAAGVACWRVWQDQGGASPAAMAGHSLGEYTALVCSGAMEFSDAIAAVAERGRLMQAAVPVGTGAMAAILGLDDAVVIDVCTQSAQGEVVAAVNFNSPGQVVIAGAKAAVERAMAAAKAAGAKRALPLPVSVPSHSALMEPAAQKLKTYLDGVTINAPVIPVYHNADVQSYSDAAQIRDALVRQLYSPVRWVETIQALAGAGIKTLIECGPGKVLVGLNKRIDANQNAVPLFDTTSLAQAQAALAG